MTCPAILSIHVRTVGCFVCEDSSDETCTTVQELEEVRLQVEAWKRMASTRAPHTDARHLQWFRQSLIEKKKRGALEAVEARALAAFESDADSIFRYLGRGLARPALENAGSSVVESRD